MINKQWYNINEQRKYPFDSTATLLNVNGETFPNNVICDIHIWAPKSVGDGLYVSSVNVSSNIVSVTINANTSTFTPIANIAVVNPRKYVNYPLNPVIDGVRGWIVFGSGISEQQLHRFDTYEATKLLPRICRLYTSNGVTGFKKPDNPNILQQLLELSSGDDVIIRPVDITLTTGKTVRGIAIGLNLRTDPTGMLLRFAGPCGGRVSEGSCDPTPLEYLNGVSPDASGNVTIEFRGGFIVSVDKDRHGMILDLPLSLDDVCNKHLAYNDGSFEDQPEDLCEESSSSA